MYKPMVEKELRTPERSRSLKEKVMLGEESLRRECRHLLGRKEEDMAIPGQGMFAMGMPCQLCLHGEGPDVHR